MEENKIIREIENGFDKLNKTLERYCNEKIENEEVHTQQGKATFTFSANSHDIDLIINRYKMVTALYELSNLRRTLERYDVPNEIYVQEGKILSDEELHDYNRTQEDIEKTQCYIKVSEVIDRIDSVLDNVPYEIFGD